VAVANAGVISVEVAVRVAPLAVKVVLAVPLVAKVVLAVPLVVRAGLAAPLAVQVVLAGLRVARVVRAAGSDQAVALAALRVSTGAASVPQVTAAGIRATSPIIVGGTGRITAASLAVSLSARYSRRPPTTPLPKSRRRRAYAGSGLTKKRSKATGTIASSSKSEVT
jgi:hypothetical protein